MTVATQITLVRLAMLPALLGFFFQRNTAGYSICLGLFVLAVLSDILDGYVARRLNQVSVQGAMLDALADKLLIYTMLFSLFYVRIYDPIVLFPMFFRDMLVDGFRNKL